MIMCTKEVTEWSVSRIMAVRMIIGRRGNT